MLLYGDGLKIPRKYKSLQFLQEQLESESFFIQQETNADNRDLPIDIGVPTGTTLYVLGVVIQNLAAGEAGFIARSFSRTVSVVVYETVTLQSNETYNFKFPIVKVIGSESTRFRIINQIGDDANATAWGYTQNTKKI